MDPSARFVSRSKQYPETVRPHGPEDFTMLYRRFYKPIYGRIYSDIQNAMDAEDITQEVFIQLFIRLSRCGPRYTPLYVVRPWLLMVARFRLCVRTRDSGRRMAAYDRFKISKADIGDGSFERPDAAVERHETQSIVGEVLDRMKRTDKELLLAIGEGFKPLEISTARRTNINTVRSQIRKAQIKFTDLATAAHLPERVMPDIAHHTTYIRKHG